MFAKKKWFAITLVLAVFLAANLAEASPKVRTLDLTGYTYNDQMEPAWDIHLIISRLERSGNTLSGEGVLEHGGTRYEIKFSGLSRTQHGFYVGHGTALPEGGESRGLFDNLTISLQQEGRFVTGVFNDLQEQPISFAAGNGVKVNRPKNKNGQCLRTKTLMGIPQFRS